MAKCYISLDMDLSLVAFGRQSKMKKKNVEIFRLGLDPGNVHLYGKEEES